jgi:hypothetical protein
MDEQSANDVPSRKPEDMHEPGDFSSRGVLVFGIVMIVAMIVLQVLLWVMFKYWSSMEKPRRLPRSPLVAEGPAMRTTPIEPREQGIMPLSPKRFAQTHGLPPEPRLEGLRLQVEPQSTEQRKEIALDQYAWVDRPKGILRIPIQAAIEAYAGQLPFRETKAQQIHGLAIPPTQSNSGRVFEIRSVQPATSPER